MDKKDAEIIRILANNSRLAYEKVGKKVKLSESGVRKRIKRMLGNNEISFSVRVNPEKAGMGVCILGIDVEPEYYVKVVEELKKDDSVIYLYTSTGDHMLMAEVWGNAVDIIKKIERIKGIKRLCPSFIVKAIK